MCLNPKWIYKSGNYKKSNYRGKEGEFYEIGTFSKCGCCEQCNAEKANNWVVRNYYEAKNHKNITFVTLTYAESPIILVKKDLQDFIKRLRDRLDKLNREKIRYFAAGEYGEINNRPHFHIIFYGLKADKIYLGINKKKNILYTDELIKKAWGKGRISVQEFDLHEIPYISLYETPKEQFKKAYKMTMEKAKKLKELSKTLIRFDKKARRNLIEELNEIIKQLKKTKEEYYAVKEFNTWSIGLGWEKFYDEYAKSNEYTFTEYIEDKEFVTPTPWVKKLANMGDIQAAREMFEREKIIKKSQNEEEERTKNLLTLQKKRKKELMEWNDKKDKLEEI